MSTTTNKLVRTIRRFFRFRLATLLALFTLFAIWLGYLSIRADRIRQAVASLNESGGRIGFDYQYDGLREKKNAKPWAPTWLRKFVGDEYFVDVANISFQGNRNISNSDLNPIKNLYSVRRIDLDYTPIDDLSALDNQSRLKWLDLEETKIDSDDLVHLNNLNNLNYLILTRTLITDDGIEFIADMTDLVELRLNETKVTDKCLAHLENLVNLRNLELSHTNVTARGIASLQDKLPDCEIKWNEIN